MKLEELRREVMECRRCSLWKARNKVVFGEGPEDAAIMLVGLGPGVEEDRQGRPFVGAAGKFLNQLLAIAGLKREEVYICNVMKCFLPKNEATEEQVEACSPYLDQQIDAIKPKVIIALGNLAKEHLFKRFGIKLQSMSKVHGNAYEVRSLAHRLTLIPTFHPAAALRNPGLREKLIEDWKKIGEILQSRINP